MGFAELIAGVVMLALFLASWRSNRTPRGYGPFDEGTTTELLRGDYRTDK